MRLSARRSRRQSSRLIFCITITYADVGFVVRVEVSGRELIQHGWAVRDEARPVLPSPFDERSTDHYDLGIHFHSPSEVALEHGCLSLHCFELGPAGATISVLGRFCGCGLVEASPAISPVVVRSVRRSATGQAAAV